MVSNPPTNLSAADVKILNGLGATLIEANNTGLGFYGKAPVAQPAAVTAVAATGATSTTPFGYTTAAQANAIVTAVNALINVLSGAAGGNGLTA